MTAPLYALQVGDGVSPEPTFAAGTPAPPSPTPCDLEGANVVLVRVAKGIFAAWCLHPDDHSRLEEKWAEWGDERAKAMSAARTVVAALHRPGDEPTRAIMKAMLDEGMTGISISAAWAVWRAMIDAILPVKGVSA